MSANIATAQNVSVDKDMTVISSAIDSYFEIQFESLKNKDSNYVNNLSDVIDLETDTGKNLVDYQIGKLKYLIEHYNIDNSTIEDYEYKLEYEDIFIEKNRAIVKLRIKESIKYSSTKDIHSNNIYHEIVLTKNNNQWLIADDKYSTEFKQAYPIGTDFEKLLKNARTMYDEYLERVKDLGKEEQISNGVIINSIPGDHYDSYSSQDRADAVWYAKKYTEDLDGCNPDYYNTSQFKTYII